LESQSGTLGYYDYYKANWATIESRREKYLDSLPAILGVAVMKIVDDYYKELGFETKDVEGTEIDKKYNIDMIAIEGDTIIVSQVKSGLVSRQDVMKFCLNAPNYILREHPDVKNKILSIAAYQLDEKAHGLFVEMGRKLMSSGFSLGTLPLEIIADRLPKYRRVFKEIQKIRS
jgi:hypothetical protein